MTMTPSALSASPAASTARAARAGVRPWPRSNRAGDPGDLASIGSDDLVSGEAVALELPPAGVGARILAGLLDLLAIVLSTFALALAAALVTSGSDAALAEAMGLLAVIGGVVVAPTAFATISRGYSPGKLAMGLRVVRDDGGPISFQHALTRSLTAVVEVIMTFGVPALLVAIIHPRGKRLGDVAAGTYVIRDRAQLALPIPPPMPPPLAAWATSADIAPVPPHLTLAVRQFLGRAHTLEPRARRLLALRLADRLTDYVAPQPPGGHPPEAFCCAVLAGRRERDLARLQREDETRVRLLRRGQT